LRETLFNVLAPRIEGVQFLDLCAGTGAVGIEALSRGAEHATFVDQSRKMCALIEANTGAIGINKEDFKIVNADASDYLRRHAKKEEPFDIIFFDPPYAGDAYSLVNLISDTGGQLLTEDGVVIVEHHKKRDLPEAFGTLRRFRTLIQGDSVLSFYKPAASRRNVYSHDANTP
jgi:16S rRNA (guanine(966)-N(2))-methyltransferase RsmD